MTDKLILMPDSLTAENGVKAVLTRRFHESVAIMCHSCFDGCNRGDCDECEGKGQITKRVPVEWTTIKEIYKRAVELLGKPQDDAITEAVAAERERCAKVCKDVRLNEISAPADWHNDACEACIRAIRSNAK